MPCQSCNLPQDQTALRGGGGEDEREGIRGTESEREILRM